ncbi:MAG TPA: hypothetical protein VMU84_05530, partial [Thermoanaerobaculia bacterium]|nr:hypothetical protein [Thermoanaerobaculia bacterium]
MKGETQMTRKTLTALFLLALVASVAAAQTLPVEAEIGYRWIDVDGNQGLYRSQINEREGGVLRSLSFFSSATAFDHLRIDATDLGVGPT